MPHSLPSQHGYCTNKEKAAVLVTSLPPVLCWLCPAEAQEATYKKNKKHVF